LNTLLRKLCLGLCISSVLCLPSHGHPNSSASKTKVVPITAPAKISPHKTQQVHFSKWLQVNEFVDEMIQKHGFEPHVMFNIFDETLLNETAITLVKPAPPSKPKNWKAYRARFLEPVRIEAGLKFWETYEDALQKAQTRYGVDAEIIVGLIGVETIFGRNTGNFRVIDVLTTLAFAYPETPNRDARMRFFRSELEQLFLLSRHQQSDIFSYKGSYAGAMGWAQFMPSSLAKFGVDFDENGKIDLINSPIDAIGSVANYLQQHGWKSQIPKAFPATLLLPEDHPQVKNALGQGLKANFQLQELSTILSSAQTTIPSHIRYGLIDLQNGVDPTEYWLASDNFFAITFYNRSYFYAMSVIDLGKVIGDAKKSISKN
jgi:membrane-bound lytic murein transglycosylase B